MARTVRSSRIRPGRLNRRPNREYTGQSGPDEHSGLIWPHRCDAQLGKLAAFSKTLEKQLVALRKCRRYCRITQLFPINFLSAGCSPTLGSVSAQSRLKCGSPNKGVSFGQPAATLPLLLLPDNSCPAFLLPSFDSSEASLSTEMLMSPEPSESTFSSQLKDI